MTKNFQDCAGQKVLLLAVTYGELSTMVPCQEFQPPLLTPPLFGVSVRRRGGGDFELTDPADGGTVQSADMITE